MLKKCVFLLLFCLQFNLQAQRVLFAGEGSEGAVRLVWYPYEWPSKSEGVIIKRRAINTEEWEIITEKTIVQEIKDGASLAHYIKDKKEALDIENFRKSKFLTGKWQNVTADEYKEKLAQDDELRTIRLGLRSDFKIAAASGFAMIDLPPKGKKEWEYGIFFDKKQKKPTKTVAVKMAPPVYELNAKSSVKVNRGIGKLRINGYWYIDSLKFVEDFKTLDFFCFKEVQGTEKIKTVFSKKLPGKLIGGYGTKFSDYAVSDSLKTTYTLHIGTIFGTTHPIASETFDPAIIAPEDLYIKTLPILDEDHDLALGLPPITWDFKVEDEKYISGFRVMEKKGFRNWVPVSDVIDKTKRSFMDPRQPINKKTYTFRVEAVLKAGMGTKSSWEEKYYYQYTPKAPAPELDYEWVEKGGGYYLKIFWGEENKTGNTVGYRIIYNYENEEEDYRMSTDGRLLKEPVYYYSVQDIYSEDYYFKVAQISADGDIGTWSAPLKTLSHTVEMPPFNVYKHEVKDKTITIHWQKLYPIKDLDAFDVYVNGKLEQSEKPQATSTSYTYSKPGKYEFKIVAKTKFGLSTEKKWIVKVEK